MHILQVNNYGYVRGGSDNYFLGLSNLLTGKGHVVIPLNTADPRNAADTRWAVNGFRPETPRSRDIVRFLYSAAAKRTVKDLLGREQVDVAHLHIYYGQLTPSILGPLKRHDIPIVQTLHEYKLFCPRATMTRRGKPCTLCSGGSFWRAAWHRCNRDSFARSLATSAEAYTSRMLGDVRNIDHFIAVSDFVRNAMIRFGIPEDRISTVHNYIDVDAYEPAYQAGDYYLYFGRIEKIKGLMTLLAAARQASARLVVAGEGALRTEVEREAARQNLAVEVVGFKSGKDLHDLIRGCRCVVVPSEWHETFGLVILEAYALGKPVIASRTGGIPEVVQEGTTGLLFEPGNALELAEAMTWMWSHPSRAVEMGRAGRKLAEDVFGKDSHCEQVLSIYKKVVR